MNLFAHSPAGKQYIVVLCTYKYKYQGFDHINSHALFHPLHLFPERKEYLPKLFKPSTTSTYQDIKRSLSLEGSRPDGSRLARGLAEVSHLWFDRWVGPILRTHWIDLRMPSKPDTHLEVGLCFKCCWTKEKQNQERFICMLLGNEALRKEREACINY